jgi:hypothetical protein
VFVDESKFADLRFDWAQKWMDAKARALLVRERMWVRNSNVLHLSKLWHPDALAGGIPADDPKSYAAYSNSTRVFGGNFYLNDVEADENGNQSSLIGYANTTNDLIT